MKQSPDEFITYSAHQVRTNKEIFRLMSSMSETAKNGSPYEADPRDCCDRCGGAKRHRPPCVADGAA